METKHYSTIELAEINNLHTTSVSKIARQCEVEGIKLRGNRNLRFYSEKQVEKMRLKKGNESVTVILETPKKIPIIYQTIEIHYLIFESKMNSL